MDCKVKIFGLVWCSDLRGKRAAVPFGTYSLHEVEPELFHISGDTLPVPFKITKEEFDQHMDLHLMVVEKGE